MRTKSFNIVQLAVVLLSLAVIVALIVPAFGPEKRPAHRMQIAMQLRGIHQGLVTYSNSNKDWYPGIDSEGTNAEIAAQARYQLLIEHEFFSSEYAISPLENDRDIQAWGHEGVVTPQHYSFAMLQVPDEGGRRIEWQATLNEQAIVMSDRNTGSRDKPQSIHNEPRDNDWQGSVLWKDNHVGFEVQHTEFVTQYGEGELNEEDRLFSSRGNDDALLIHSGN